MSALIRELNDVLNEHNPGWDANTDCAPAINYAFSQGTYRLIKNPGQHRIASTVNAGGRQIEGFGLMCSFRVDMNSGVAFQYSIPGGGMKGCSLHLNVPGDTLTYGINLSGDASTQADQTNFEDLYITSQSGGYWWTAMQLNGLARDHPIGVRVVNLQNVQLFNSRNWGLTVLKGVQVMGENVGIWTGKEQNPGGSLYIQDSYNPYFYGLTCSYVVKSNVQGGEIRGMYIGSPLS